MTSTLCVPRYPETDGLLPFDQYLVTLAMQAVKEMYDDLGHPPQRRRVVESTSTTEKPWYGLLIKYEMTTPMGICRCAGGKVHGSARIPSVMGRIAQTHNRRLKSLSFGRSRFRAYISHAHNVESKLHQWRHIILARLRHGHTNGCVRDAASLSTALGELLHSI